MDEQRIDEMARRLSGPDWEKQRRLLADPWLRSIARGLDIDLDSVELRYRDVRDGLAALMQAAIWFAPFGWTVSPRNLRTSDYADAVEIWRRSQDRAAIDERLTRAWADVVWLRHSYGPMIMLAGDDEATRDGLLVRDQLLDKAVGHHLRGEYEASTLIVLTQVDGLTYDITRGKHGFFYEAKDDDFEDADTIAGMPEVLSMVRRAVNRDAKRTSLSGEFHRHAIVHGRYPGFGTATNSAKAFALLGGVIEWLEPKAIGSRTRLRGKGES